MENKEQIIGADNICPVTKQLCDDECCPPGAVCNLSGDGKLSPFSAPSKLKLTPNNEVVIVEEPIILGENGKRIVQHIKDKQKECQQKLDAKITEAKEWAEKVNQTLNWSDKESIDQELEDAANKASLRIYAYESEPRISRDVKIGFIDGANWKAEQVANDAIEFAEWTLKNRYLSDPDGEFWLSDFELDEEVKPFTTKELYELWQQNKKK